MTEEDMAGVDKKTAAYLRSLNRRGFFGANQGETLLLPGEDRLKADKVILKGLGPKEEITLESFLQRATEAAMALRCLSVCNFVVRIPMLFGLNQYREQQIKKTVESMIPPFLAGERIEEEPVITAVFSVERAVLEDIAEVESSLKEYFTDVVPFSLVTEASSKAEEI